MHTLSCRVRQGAPCTVQHQRIANSCKALCKTLPWQGTTLMAACWMWPRPAEPACCVFSQMHSASSCCCPPQQPSALSVMEYWGCETAVQSKSPSTPTQPAFLCHRKAGCAGNHVYITVVLRCMHATCALLLSPFPPGPLHVHPMFRPPGRRGPAWPPGSDRPTRPQG
jgi:hypothetical protein